MGIPYSKQIHLAFDQVAPLVAAGFKVLQTTKNITFLLAAIQILTVVLLVLILITLLALCVIISPDLETERKVLVTPVLKWLVRGVLRYGVWSWSWVQVCFWTVGIGAVLGAGLALWVTAEHEEEVVVEVSADGTQTGEDDV